MRRSHALHGYLVAMLKPLGTRSLAALVALCALASLFLAGGALARGSLAHASGTPAGAPLGGVNIELGYGDSPAAVKRTIALARALHSRVVRIELAWSAFEPIGPRRIDTGTLAFTDSVIADAAAAGITVIATVRSTPCWASSAPAPVLKLCSLTRATTANAWPPRDPATYAAFVAFLAHRYGPRLAAIEIWNEPDQSNELYFAGPNKARQYAALVRAAYPAIKLANPSVPVLAGSLVGSNGIFLRALYADGMKGYYDGLAVHFYTLTLAALRSIRQVQLQNGDSKPLWLDEFGWSSCWPRRKIQEEQACVTPQVQAANIVNVFRSLARTTYVAAEVIFQLQDTREEQFGVRTFRGAPKPAFKALAGVLAAPFARPGPMTLRLARRHGRVVASGTGPIGDFMQLEAFKQGVLRYKATFILDRFNRYSITIPRVLGSTGLLVRTYQFWTGPSAAAQKSI
jgi:Cellulase (glycosyl hydrolase family 5)